MSASSYLENKVICADPLGLVKLLYEGAIDSLRQAQAHLEEGRIPERSAAITKAMQIVLELQCSLDLERGGDIAQRLAQLYAYVQERLAEANAQQDPAPLEEALMLIGILYEGWREIAGATAMPPPVEPSEAQRIATGWTV